MTGTVLERATGLAAELLELTGDALTAAQDVRLDIQAEWDAYEAARVAHERVARLLRSEQISPAPAGAERELALIGA